MTAFMPFFPLYKKTPRNHLQFLISNYYLPLHSLHFPHLFLFLQSWCHQVYLKLYYLLFISSFLFFRSDLMQNCLFLVVSRCLYHSFLFYRIFKLISFWIVEMLSGYRLNALVGIWTKEFLAVYSSCYAFWRCSFNSF